MSIATLKPRIANVDTRQGSSAAVDRIRGWELTKIRGRIGLRDTWLCRACGLLARDGQVDHVMPLHLGGAESDENRQWLCRDCHDSKNREEEKGR